MKLSIASDYIAPSTSCVVSLDGKRLDLAEDDTKFEVKIHNRDSEPSKGPVKVTLHDCLACSGCLTSAETVMLEHQGIDELLDRLKDPAYTVVVSISPQSRSSLAAFYGLGPTETFRKLITLFRSIGVAAVFDTTCSRDLSLLETAAEFISRYRAMEGHQETRGQGEASTSAQGPLPLLVSSCPGWVVYSEKTHGEEVLPFLSRVRSPQGIMGALVKRLWCRGRSLDPARTYHCAVMPCYDRKLEAARDELTLPSTGPNPQPPTPETDSVLATAEVQLLIKRLGIDFMALAPSPIPTDALISVDAATGALCGYPGSAGGYLEYVFRAAVKELFGEDVPPGPLPRTPGRNVDTWEVTWRAGDRTVLRFATAYGFRNVKSTVRKLNLQRRGAGGGAGVGAEGALHFIEIMACPSGCLNGGGQLLPAPGGPAAMDALDAAHHAPEILLRDPSLNPAVQQFYAEAGAGPGGEAVGPLLWTSFRSRKADAAAAAALAW